MGAMPLLYHLWLSPFSRKVRIVLGEKGIDVSLKVEKVWERREDGYYIKELSCPYYQVGQKHPEVCLVDRTMISNFLAVPATRVNCILDGDSYCTYVVPLIQPTEIQITDP